MCWLFPCITILRGVFLIKKCKKCVCVIALKIALLLMKSVFINVGGGISELSRWVAAKHTTAVRAENIVSFIKFSKINIQNTFFISLL